MARLEIKNLHVSKGHRKILKGLDLVIDNGEIHAVFGPNGHGKTTLFLTILGHPECRVEEGEILLDGENILKWTTDERARKGLFLSFQNPTEIPGVNTSEFFKAALNSRRETPIQIFPLYKLLRETSEEVGLSFENTNRNLNEGFSGGEKKKNEIFQLRLLQPKIALLDEIDSGLDVDAVKKIAGVINQCRQGEFSALIVSHYFKLFEMLPPTHVHLLKDGKIIATGGQELIAQIEKEGFKSDLHGRGTSK